MWLPYSNDNPPEFDPPDYFTPVTKSVKVGTKLIRVVVEYVITSGNSSSKFKLDKTSGWITVASSLTSDMKKIFLIGITASDKGNPPLSSRTSVRIAVTEENHHTPEFSQSQISATVPESLAVGTAIRTLSYYFEISEAAPKGTVVGEVFASDRDQGEDGVVYYLIFGKSRRKGFGINRRTGQIYVTGTLDREKEEKISLRVLAKNAGSIRGADIDEVFVNITILDANDPPVFTQELYDVQVSEGLSPGGLVTFVSAEDSDSVPSWSRFSYSIAPEFDKNVFTINPKTGQVSVAAELDRETTPVYNLTVLAVDTGTPPATGSATVIVNLEDINDNGPTLTTAYAEVMENQRAGTAVTTLTASDPDLPPNQGPFLYSLLSSGSANNYDLAELTKQGYLQYSKDSILSADIFISVNHSLASSLITSSPGLFLSSGVFGKHCELNSYGFEELSYMEFPSLDPNNNYIYIKFATLKSNALLMYNHDNQTGDKAEFLALEIIEGRMRFSFNLGSGTYKLMTMIKVADGQFHTVIARRAGMVRTPIYVVEISSYSKWFFL
uniref:Uncharacterized protein n=1 Tax=Seriola lalandi dorsalis TaxID=1841481 RepID=A0A3B4YBK5_SERLL